MRSFHILPVGLLMCTGLFGQIDREAYRQAYDRWRQAHADLERDAGTGGAAQVAQADRAAAAVAALESTREAYLKTAAEDAAEGRKLLPSTVTRPSPDAAAAAVADLAARELQTVTRTIARFATDPDRGIQQLRQSLERERIALAALNDSIKARQNTVTATGGAAEAVEQVRAKAAETFGGQDSQVSLAVTQLEKEGIAWADYYDKLAQAIQAASAPPPVPIAPAAPKSTSITPVPLVRYVGAWTYPVVNGVFHGAQPDSAELVVREQNGHADGTLSARFKLPPGSAVDPSLEFKFEGDFAATLNQRFTLVTTEGVQGFLELIPGPAFNLLEVNFQTDLQPNKIRTGNFILVKK